VLHFILDPANARGGRADLGNLARFKEAVGRVKKAVSRSLFQLLFVSIRKNPDIQRYAAKRLAVFVTHSEHESMATRCIVEMLSENRELQESEVSEREIKVFMNMLRRNPMHPLFLNLLKATCECSGLGVDQNQQLVANILMEPRNRKLLINIRTMDGKPFSETAAAAKKKRPKTGSRPQTPPGLPGWMDDSGGIGSMGMGGVGAGLDPNQCDLLIATWASDDSPEFSPMALYGKAQVPLIELFDIYQNSRVRALKRTISSGSQYAMVRSGESHAEHHGHGGATTAGGGGGGGGGEKSKLSKFRLKETESPPKSPARGGDPKKGLSFKGKMTASMLRRTSDKPGAERVPVSWELDLSDKMGMTITSSALVGDVKPGSQAEAGGLEPGCKLLSVGGVEVSCLDDVKREVAAAKAKGGDVKFVTVVYDPPGTSLADVARVAKALNTVAKAAGSPGPREASASSSAAAVAASSKPGDGSPARVPRPVTPGEGAWTAAAGAGTLASRLKQGKQAAIDIKTTGTPRASGSEESQLLEAKLEGLEAVEMLDIGKGGGGVATTAAPGGEHSHHHHHHHHHHHSRKVKVFPTVMEMRRKMVADYVIRQLYLLGSMCLGRNYVSMRLVERDFPYDLLVAIVTDKRMPKDFRSGAVYLINCLYVDSNPQTEKMIPELIRSWSNVRVDGPVMLPGALESVTRAKQDPLARTFADLKEVIVGHLNMLVRLSGDDFTLQLMSLLQRLMKFRFYTSAAQMQSVVQPILRTLDDRRSLPGKAKGPGGSGGGPDGAGGLGGRGELSAKKRAPSMFSSAVSSSSIHPDSPGGSIDLSGPMSPGGENGGEEDGGSPGDSRLKTAAGEQPAAKQELPWFLKPRLLLKWMESIRVMAVILVVVLVSVGLALWTQFTGLEPHWLTVFDMCVFVFFALDITVRYSCYLIDHDFSLDAALDFWDFYRSVDGGCVSLDVASLLAGAAMRQFASGSKLLKVLRLFRLVRLIRAGNIMLEIMSKLRVDDTEIFQLPRRYDSTPRAELRMMANVVDVLTHVAKVAQDFRLSRLLQAFRAYNELRLSGQRSVRFDGLEISQRTTPAEIFECVGGGLGLRTTCHRCQQQKPLFKKTKSSNCCFTAMNLIVPVYSSPPIRTLVGTASNRQTGVVRA